MRRIVSGSLGAILVAVAAIPAPAWAATVSRSNILGPAGDDDVVIVDDDEMEGTDEPTTPAPSGETPAEGSDVESDLFGGDTETAASGDGAVEVGKQDADSEEKLIKAEMGLISVVQRQRMLKKKRFELQPQFGITINDPYVRHYTLGLDFTFWITNRLGIGLTGTGLIGNVTPRYRNIRLQEGLLLTANQVLWQASANLSYNPFYGKIAIFNRALLHWETAIMIGGGATQTRVIPRYIALHEPFTNVTGGGHVTLMGRFYGPRADWISVNLGFRVWLYPDKLEPGQRGPDESDLPELDDPAAAKAAAQTELGFNVTAFLGVSFYFPTTFEYSTPR